ncbi:DUF6233 domain-containing protein [Streptomyces sp. NPDC057456]|uniref:DUF6233 domain-containing protein n=1 Tax=Streptomyces sp. NPDC057456 TaxID=3346139 RepID=UPI0036A63373
MHDSTPSHLALLCILERVQQADVERTRRWIAAEERDQERQRGTAARPPQPEWLLELGLNRDSPPNLIHEGQCHTAGKRARGIGHNGALRWLAEGIPACTHCRPDSGLGYLDG